MTDIELYKRDPQYRDFVDNRDTPRDYATERALQVAYWVSEASRGSTNALNVLYALVDTSDISRDEYNAVRQSLRQCSQPATPRVSGRFLTR